MSLASSSRASSESSWPFPIRRERVALSCSLQKWERLKNHASHFDSVDEELNTLKRELEADECQSSLLQSRELVAHIANMKVLNGFKLKKIEILRRMCVKKQLDIAATIEKKNEVTLFVISLNINTLSKLDNLLTSKCMNSSFSASGIGNKSDREISVLDKRCTYLKEMIQQFNHALIFKEKYLNVYRHLLRVRRLTLIQDLAEVFDIQTSSSSSGNSGQGVPNPTCSCSIRDRIHGIHLPFTVNLNGHNEVQISAALGLLAHLLDLISRVLDYPLRYPVTPCASSSHIIFPRLGQSYALYGTRWKADRDRLVTAVTAMNWNIAQLRSDCGLTTAGPEKTLQQLQNWMQLTQEACIRVDFYRRPWQSVNSPAILMDPRVEGADENMDSLNLLDFINPMSLRESICNALNPSPTSLSLVETAELAEEMNGLSCDDDIQNSKSSLSPSNSKGVIKSGTLSDSSQVIM